MPNKSGNIVTISFSSIDIRGLYSEGRDADEKFAQASFPSAEVRRISREHPLIK